LSGFPENFFAAYVVVGPVFSAALLISLAMGRARMGKLRRPPLDVPSPSPHVTALIPAKDEGPNIARCLDSVLAQDYPHLRVIAIDDRSGDDTGRIMDEYAARLNSRVRALHIAHGSLPPGWLGKCHALYVAEKNVEDPWIWFVDSDVALAPDALRATLALAEHRHYDAVSILTRLECHGFWERLILPLAAAAWSILHVVSLTNDDNRKDHALANGQFLLVRRRAYEAVGGHEAVRDRITEDVELMRLLKANDFRTRLFMGRDFATTRMHTSLNQMFHGWGRIFSGSANRKPWRILTGIVFLICGLCAYPSGVWGIYRANQDGVSYVGLHWLAAAVLHLVLLTIFLSILYRWSGNRRRYAAAFPLASAMLLAIFTFALRMCATGRVKWRGTSYSQATGVNRSGGARPTIPSS
jgi:chlorobactene glucosyltransferase